MTPNFPGPLECHELRALFAPMQHPLVTTMPDPDILTLDQIRAVMASAEADSPDARLTYPRHLRAWLRLALDRVEALEKKVRLVEDCATGQLISTPL